MCNLSSELGVLEDNWATCQPFSLCHCVVPLDYHLPCIHRCVLADIWAYYWAIITFATVGYGDLHAYNEVEAAFIIIFVFLNIVINAACFCVFQLGSLPSDRPIGSLVG